MHSCEPRRVIRSRDRLRARRAIQAHILGHISDVSRLAEHGVHRLLVRERVARDDLVERERLEVACEQRRCDFLNHVVRALAAAARHLWLQREHDLTQLVRLVLCSGGEGVGWRERTRACATAIHERSAVARHTREEGRACAHVMSAFSCSPKTFGCGLSGSPPITVR